MRERWIQVALKSKQSSKPFGDNVQQLSQELVPVQSVPQELTALQLQQVFRELAKGTAFVRSVNRHAFEHRQKLQVQEAQHMTLCQTGKEI